MTRSMLNDKKLPNNYWAQVVVVAIHLLNISAAKAMRNITPMKHGFIENLISAI